MPKSEKKQSIVHLEIKKVDNSKNQNQNSNLNTKSLLPISQNTHS